ncbi:hypothetical protein QTP70_015603 [Hemibagrus guttatus]|uniref:Uncharacterized protein n=1 Tax=Hemibagrus guttatus TaxID=175788 RepID=A0AAE0UTR5_9TELE|nr:hypothetical protein QTP70_015603 [Hemibagrus guttatus]
MYLPWMTGSAIARESGTVPTFTYSVPRDDRRYRLTVADAQIPVLKPARPREDDTTLSNEPPPLLDIDRTLVYRVNTLLNSLHHRNHLQTGRGTARRNDPESMLTTSLVEEFHCLHPNRPAPRARGHPQCRTPGGVPRGGAL